MLLVIGMPIGLHLPYPAHYQEAGRNLQAAFVLSEPLAKLPAQNGQAAILACCERFLVAVERRPRARLS